MIPPIILRYLPHLIALVAIVGGVWSFGHNRYEAGQEAARAEMAADVARAAAETARIDAERARLADRIEHDLQPKLKDATDRANSLSSRLWAYTRSRPLPQAPGTAPEPSGSTGESADGDPVGEALTAHLGACARDATRLAGWQEWYAGISGQ